MGTNATGCTEWERDYDPVTEQPRRAHVRKTHCWRGHPLSGPNLRVKRKRNGYIEHWCKACHAIYDKNRYERIKLKASPAETRGP